MWEMERITEKEYAYFEKLEKEGKAMIIHIDIRELIRTDLDEMFGKIGGNDNEAAIHRMDQRND